MVIADPHREHEGQDQPDPIGKTEKPEHWNQMSATAKNIKPAHWNQMTAAAKSNWNKRNK